MASERIKCLEINLTTEAKDLYTENYKTLLKGIKEDSSQWEDTLSLRIRRLNIVKMSMLPKAIYRFNALLKSQWYFFVEIEKNPKIHMKSQSTHNSQNSLEKEEQSWRPHTS